MNKPFGMLLQEASRMYFRQMSDTGMSPAWAQPGRRFLYSLINFQKMRKVIAAINMTLDGYCDHTYGIADEEQRERIGNTEPGMGDLKAEL